MRKRTRHIQMSDEDRKTRMFSIGGSDAKIIMSGDQKAIEQLWMEKRGEADLEDLSEIILINLGNLTEPLNLDLFEDQTGFVVTDEQRKVFHPEFSFIHSTLDGIVRETETGPALGLLEAKFMMPFHWSLEKAIEKYWPQIQHNMLVNQMDHAWLSVLTGAAQYVNVKLNADVFYQVKLLQAERDFWDAVQSGDLPGNPEVKADLPKFEEMKVVDMATNNEWVDLAQTILISKSAADQFKKAEKDIKKLMPDDAKEASGRGVKISRTKDNKLKLTVDKKAMEQAVREEAAKQAALAA